MKTVSVTVDSEAARLASEFNQMGFEFEVTVHELKRLILSRDITNGHDYDCWVESASRHPRDLEDYPHIVYCVQSNEAGSVPVKTYKPLPL